jgi:exopolysaccharide biosynthesis polyprenyl glycosylphosphotransferase
MIDPLRTTSSMSATAETEPAALDGAIAEQPRRKAHAPWARDALRRRLLAAADACAIAICTVGLGFTAGEGPMLVAYVLATVTLLIVVAKMLGLYDRDHRYVRHLTLNELPGIVALGAIASAESIIVLTFLGAQSESGTELTQFVLVLPFTVAVLRTCARLAWRAITPPERVVIVGSGALERATRRKFELLDTLHGNLTATLEDRDALRGSGLPKLVELLDELERKHGGTDRLIIADTVGEAAIADLVPLCRAREIKLGLIPPARGMFATAVDLDHIGELPIVQFNTWNVSRTTQWGKRTVDLALSLVALILTAPVMPVIALLIRRDSPGPILFRQRRSGKDGVPFTMLKFRTMIDGAEEMLENALASGAIDELMFKFVDDPRRTRVGRVLRRTSLDELPQLVNVLRGEMSLVGPRPEQIELVERYPPDVRRIRLGVKPGITGPMQVSGRGALTFEERVAIERDYVEKLSLRRDLAILLMTVSAVVRQRGAY